MKAEEYFVVRPTSAAVARFQELGVEPDDELVKPAVWCQAFEQRAIPRSEFDSYVRSSVKLWFLASLLSQLRQMSIDLSLSLQEFDEYWSVEWIGQNVVDADEIAGDLVPEVLEALAAESRQSNSPAGSDFDNLIQRIEGGIK